MKKIFVILMLFGGLILSCNSTKPVVDAAGDKPVLKENDTVRIADAESEFELIILDPAFNGWFNMNARPRNFYSQSYLEARNRTWVVEWNNRAIQPSRFGGIYDLPINYYSTTDYGFEVNYMLFNYLTYFQLKYNQRLGGFPARI